MGKHWLETWRIHSRINQYILAAIDQEAIDAPTPKKGRSFVAMFAHIHNVRLMWLQSGVGDQLAGLEKIGKDATLDRTALQAALKDSAEANEAMLAIGLAKGGWIRGFKPHATAFIGYLISHEAYHQAEIGLAMAEAGYPLDRKTAYGMYEWGVR